MESKTALEFSLDGKCAMVTGAASGIGRAAAETMARYGADVILSDLNSDPLPELSNYLADKFGIKAYPRHLDVTKKKEIDALVSGLIHQIGKIDILINSAGINIPQSATEVTEECWDSIQSVNLKGSFFCCQAVGKTMIERKYGKIINISSQAGSRGLLHRAAYCSSKGGVDQMTRVLALEWSKYNINVNSLAPTFVMTPLTSKMFEDESFNDYVYSKLLIPRLATTDDLTGALVFLASRASDMMSGSVLYVDGGWTAH